MVARYFLKPKSRKETWQKKKKQNAEMFMKALLTTDGRNNKNATEIDAEKIMSDTKNWYNDDVKTSYKTSIMLMHDML